jgi:hypothetical protein
MTGYKNCTNCYDNENGDIYSKVKWNELWRREDIENDEDNIFYNIWKFHDRKTLVFKGRAYYYDGYQRKFRDELIDNEEEDYKNIMADHKKELYYFLLPFCYDLNNLIISFIDFNKEGILSVIPFIYPPVNGLKPRQRRIKLG